jgi:hypothetical protein
MFCFIAIAFNQQVHLAAGFWNSQPYSDILSPFQLFTLQDRSDILVAKLLIRSNDQNAYVIYSFPRKRAGLDTGVQDLLRLPAVKASINAGCPAKVPLCDTLLENTLNLALRLFHKFSVSAHPDFSKEASLTQKRESKDPGRPCYPPPRNAIRSPIR